MKSICNGVTDFYEIGSFGLERLKIYKKQYYEYKGGFLLKYCGLRMNSNLKDRRRNYVF
jgi:hypothetical protein